MLLEDISPNKVKKEFKTSTEWFEELDDFNNEKTDALGSGSYASVIDSNVIGEVTKILYGVDGSGYKSIDEIKRDPYVDFILAIAENNVSDGNPFLPRLGMIETIMGRDNTFYLKIHMEKLHPFKTVDSSSAEGIARILYGESKDFSKMEHAYKIIEDYSITDIEHLQLTLFPLWAFLGGSYLMSNIVDTNYRPLTKALTDVKDSIEDNGIRVTNNEMKEALKLVNNIKNGTLDLHFNNVMIRRTSIGPQLVIIDPLAW